jgi:ATP-binding cassette, subfamily B, multidrug efflux pump
VQEYFGTMTTLAQENLAGTRIVRAYRQEAAEEARFAAMNAEYLARNMSLVRLYGAMNPLFALIAGVGAVTVLGFGGTLAARGAITIGDFVAFGFYLGILTWPLIALGWVINLFQRGAASMARLNELLDARPLVTEVAAPRTLPATAEGRTLEFRDVGFHYPTEPGTEPRWVLRHVSFIVPAGGTLGVVGATGSGKSALLDLIPRLHDPQEGQVLVDGIPVTELSLSQLRAEVGFAPQESLLFSDTIGENLRYGTFGDAAPPAAGADGLSGAGLAATDAGAAGEIAAATREAADDAADVRWAAEVAQLDESVRGFPDGYSTVLGERGINLSGGQKQRAALARALARRPSVVLLDDALSAVDTHTEARILAGLRGALRGRTSVIASHRASAIRDAGWTVVLDGGRVVEQGRHDELMERGGRYWALLRRQQLEESIEDDAPAAMPA